MSGGNGGGYVPPVKHIKFDCTVGVIITVLASINIELVADCSVGDIFDVAVIDNAVIIENKDGEILGSVLHEMVNALKDCIKLGYTYQAEIISLSGLNCKVRIRNA